MDLGSPSERTTQQDMLRWTGGTMMPDQFIEIVYSRL
jgi:hypothetical protein